MRTRLDQIYSDHGAPPYAFVERLPCALLNGSPLPYWDWGWVSPRARVQAITWGLREPPGSLSGRAKGHLLPDLTPRQLARVSKQEVWEYGALVPEFGRYRSSCEEAIATLPPYHPLRTLERISLTGKTAREADTGSYNAFRRYYPDRRRASLYMELASVRLDSSAEVLAFVREYGLPRHERNASAFSPYPLLVFAHDVCRIRYLLQLGQAVLRGRANEARDAFDHLSILEAWDITSSDELGWRADEVLSAMAEGVVRSGVLGWKTAADILSQKVASHAQRLMHFMEPIPGPDDNTVAGLRPIYATETLLSACYFMLYWDLTASAPVHTCQSTGCGAFFYATRPDRKYCSPECRNRANVRRHYWRQREAARTTG